MTRQTQKCEERQTLKQYLRFAGIHVLCEQIDEGERPDFIVKLPQGKVGIEITRFHITCKRREVEEYWKALREFAWRRANYPQTVQARIYFRRLRMPHRRDFEAFTDELFALSSLGVDGLIKIESSSYPTLAKYVDCVGLASAKVAPCWTSNIDGAAVGATENELLRLVQRKAASTERSAATYWLIIAGGSDISQMLAFIDHQWLVVMKKLTLCLEESPFSRLVLDQNPVIEWRRDTGWATVGPFDQNEQGRPLP